MQGSSGNTLQQPCLLRCAINAEQALSCDAAQCRRAWAEGAHVLCGAANGGTGVCGLWSRRKAQAAAVPDFPSLGCPLLQYELNRVQRCLSPEFGCCLNADDNESWLLMIDHVSNGAQDRLSVHYQTCNCVTVYIVSV